MSPKRTRPKTLGTNPPSALVTHPGTPNVPMQCRNKPLTPHLQANVYSQWPRGYSSFNITVKWNYRFLSRFGPAFSAFARPNLLKLGSAFGTGRRRRRPLSARPYILGKRSQFLAPCPSAHTPASFAITPPPAMEAHGGL